jgi:hypothetical protein
VGRERSPWEIRSQAPAKVADDGGGDEEGRKSSDSREAVRDSRSDPSNMRGDKRHSVPQPSFLLFSFSEASKRKG